MYSMPVIGEPHASTGLIGPRFSVTVLPFALRELSRRQFVPTIAPEIAGWSGVDCACPGGGTSSLISVTLFWGAMV